ncbi:hypothetical protein EVA_19378 [gut metagenome]|uniref:Uncharacterized protein n=1 Tax=gut metagenome TaxID=749906 RepID=J9FCA4_9ZZZZ
MVHQTQWSDTHHFGHNLSRQYKYTHNQYESSHIAQYGDTLGREPSQINNITLQPSGCLPTKKDSHSQSYKRNNLLDDSIKQALHKSYTR